MTVLQVIELADGETVDDHMQLKWHRVGEEMDEEDIDEMDQMIHSEANSHNRAVSKSKFSSWGYGRVVPVFGH